MTAVNVDLGEVNKFGAQAERWWDETGDLKTLHQVNPLRLQFIQSHIDLKGCTALDVGCGGGILSEALARHGAITTGIDMSAELIEIAQLHALGSGIHEGLDYRCMSAESLAETMPASYDLVTCMEMLEHVPKPEEVVRACASMVRPGGLVCFSTLNRNLKSWLGAIVAAEYLLRMLPRGTHDFSTFIRPSELGTWCRRYGLEPLGFEGISYNPLTASFSLSPDIDINYLAAFRRVD